jgi:hypothetical protein
VERDKTLISRTLPKALSFRSAAEESALPGCQKYEADDVTLMG